MGCLLAVLSLLLFSAVSHANLQAQMYWHTVLPNTAMPSAILDLLHPDVWVDEKTGTSMNVGKGGINVNTSYNKKFGCSLTYSCSLIYSFGTMVDDSKKSSTSASATPAMGTQIRNDPIATLFLLKNDLHSGAKMPIDFTSPTNVATFLPRRVAENLPFSSEKAPEIFSEFSIDPNSVEAEVMKTTIKVCEEPAAEGEQKVCATSLESMVDFSTTSLGTRDLVAASTTVGTGAEKEQEYTMAGVRKLAGSELVACHLEPYAYAVFYCHMTHKTTAYNVEMVGKNGAKVDAVAVCHADTTSWNPGHVAFKVLKVKPGTVSVCHFVPQDHIVWAHNN